MPNAVWGADFKNQRLTNLAAGANPGDAVNFQQLLDAIRGLDVKDPVRAATTAAITLSGTQVVDGVTLAVGDRVLVKNQASAVANGIYVVSASGWSRATDADDGTEVSNGLSVAVLEGTNKGTGSAVSNPVQYVLTTTGAITVGTTALSFGVVGGSGGSAYSPGTGILISGGQIAIDPSYVGFIGRYDADLAAANAGTAQTVTHNLGSKDISIVVYEVSTGIEQDGVAAPATANTVTVTFPAAIAAGAYRISIKK
jgi:hypothetical protein